MGQSQSNDSTGNLNKRLVSVKNDSKKNETPPPLQKTENPNSKRKLTRLGTIRRKLARTLKTGKSSDYGKHIRDLVGSWSLKEIEYFVKEYECLEILKELKMNCDKARVTPSNLVQDLWQLRNDKKFTDLVLKYDNMEFLVHKTILMNRCQFFKTLMEKSNSSSIIELDNILDVNKDLFGSLLNYIYTGETKDKSLLKLLPKLGETFGELNNLFTDMNKLLQSEDYDLLLIFQNVVTVSDDGSNGSIENCFEIPCHSSVLCARSSYFRSLLLQKLNQDDLKSPLKLVLSESIIPRAYIKIILLCMYTDVLDLGSIIKWKLADDGTGEADRLLTTVELAMEIAEIAGFLDFPQLLQGCEDVIVNHLNVASLLGVLEWSWQPFGSKYVYRQALNYFSEEFCSLCKVNMFLANLQKKFLLDVIKTDFIQATEEFILATVIKWGEWKFARGNENPGSSPANSFPRRSPKRRDINNEVLLEIISDLLPFVRLQHIQPVNSSVLQFAYQRGLLRRPFPFDMVAEQRPPSIVYWVREFRYSGYIRPRLFMAYYYEAKLVLHEQLNNENESGSCVGSSATLPYQLNMPDMLPPPSQHNSRQQIASDHNDKTPSVSLLEIMQLSCHLIKDVIMREKELKRSTLAVQAFNKIPDNYETSKYIQLQVIREFGLPDEVADEIFQQKPDLLEDSDSSSSSKHSTLNKVGYLLLDEANNSACMDIVANVVNEKLLCDNTKALVTLTNTEIELETSTKSISPKTFADSPLDLPYPCKEAVIEQDLLTSLPNE